MFSLFTRTDSDNDSVFDPDFSIRSNETSGDNLFDKLPLASGNVLNIYGQDTCRDSNDDSDVNS